MNAAPPQPSSRARRRLPRFAAAAIVLGGLLLLLLGWLLQPPQATGFLLQRLGAALDLRITAGGAAEYRLRGTPQLLLRDVVAQRPGDPTPMLRAERVFVSLPWSTIRARGGELVVQRVELDAPQLDLPALQRWLDTRPPGETRVPTLRAGLRVVRGRIRGPGWEVDGIDLALPSLAPGAPVQARMRGRYLDPPTKVPFDLALALDRPANGAGLDARGAVAIESTGWTLPARVRLAGPLRFGDGAMRMSPARFGMSARYRSATSDLPFTLGAHGPLLHAGATWSLDPATLVLAGQGAVPDARARGALALGRRLVLRLDGAIAAWPQAWPPLPPPLSAATSPMDFGLDYAGSPDFGDPAALRLRRDDTVLDARFRLPAVLAWLEADPAGSPLPPLQGSLRTPRIEIAGARLEGVEIEIDDPALARPRSP